MSSGGVDDVNRAVEAARVAFEEGEWGKMNARDRGKLLFRLADLMEEHKEELATIESIDSGAVYTLALKTHVGMSIETWRYFAGNEMLRWSIIFMFNNHHFSSYRMVRQDSWFDHTGEQCSSE